MKYQPRLRFLGLSDDEKSILLECLSEDCRYFVPWERTGSQITVLGCSYRRMLIDDNCPADVSCESYKSNDRKANALKGVS